jgi:cytochrome c553
MALLIGTTLVVLLLSVLFFWLAVRAARARPLAVRILGTFVSGVLGLALAAFTVLAIVGAVKLNTSPYQYTTQTASIPVTGGPDQLARGKQLAQGCTGCHSSTGNLPLDGGKDDFLAGGPPLGSLYAPDLTPSGPIKDWTDAEVIRAIREGVDKDDRPLVIMPSGGFHGLSDADVQAVVAYLRSQPPSNREVPAPSFTALAGAFFGAGMFPTSAQPPINGPVTAPPRAATADYGRYLTTATGCKDCHGENLTGGQAGGPAPAGPNLFALVPSWSEQQFITFFRSGTAPNGSQIDPNNMPWKDYSKIFEDQDLQGLYLYLKSKPAAGG